jgi:DNA-binding MarR family transcriptional regulator
MHTFGPVDPGSEHVPEPATPEDAVTGLMMALGRRMRQRQPGDAIDFAAFPVLKVLSHHGPMRLSSLAQTLQLDASTVSRHARQLEDRGLIERTEDPDDRRASRVTVSAHGEQCLAQGLAARHQVIAQALSGWSEQERETLRTLLHRLVLDLTPDAADDRVAEEAPR